MKSTVAFVPSPLLPSSRFFGTLMRALGAAGVDCVATSVREEGVEGEPWHERHVRSAARGLGRRMWPTRRYVLVGYSGSGPLLPYIADRYGVPPDGYVFIDASLPHPGRSRLDEVRESAPDAAVELEGYLSSGAAWPAWTDDELASVMPDAGMRTALLEMLRPQGATFWTEPMPGTNGWPDAPCGYLRLSEAYDAAASEARRRGWATRSVEGTHFDAYARAELVARELASLLEEMA